MTRVLTTVAILLGIAAPAVAQATPPQRMISLGDLQRAARASDPRVQSPGWLQQQSDLRLQSLAMQRYPTMSLEGQAQTQSDAATSPLALPNGTPAFSAPKTTYDLSMRVDQHLIDPTLSAQVNVERARSFEERARVETSLFGLRQQVNDAFFAAAALEQRRASLRATIADLAANLQEINARVQQGTVLAADAQSLEATLLQRQEDDAELAANRQAALAQLVRLTGQTVDPADALLLPDLLAQVGEVRQAEEMWRARPEYREFETIRARLARQQELAAAQDRPQVFAYGRFGVGHPGLNFASHSSEPYALGGVQLRWRAWTWGASSRDRAVLSLQERIVAADQGAFTTQVARAAEADLATIDRLNAAIETDERIVALREQVVRTTETRLREGAAMVSEYVDRSTDLLQARITRARHQVERAEAGARLLTTIGMEVR